MIKTENFTLLILLPFLIISLLTAAYITQQKRPLSPKLKAGGEKVKVFFLPIGNTTVSKSFDMRISLNTQGQTLENPDLILVFNKPVNFLPSESSWGNIFKPKGSLGFVFDKNAKKLTIMGLGSFNGSGNLATIKISAESEGKLEVKVSSESFSPNLTFEETSVTYNVL